jgi:hypothetical protein
LQELFQVGYPFLLAITNPDANGRDVVLVQALEIDVLTIARSAGKTAISLGQLLPFARPKIMQHQP